MLMSHMESKGQRWPNVRLENIDVSTAFNYGNSDMMMNNLWMYDLNILEDPQNDHISNFEQVSSEFTVSDPSLSSKFLIDMDHNIENADPNFTKPQSETLIHKDTEIIESKPPQLKGQRSKRSRRTVFENPWTPSLDLYGSNDNQGSGTSKRALIDDVSKPTYKIQKGMNLDNNEMVSVSSGKSVNSVGRWLEDVGFGRYADVFEMHEVDEEALPLLTLDDLKEMGVLAVGPRRKLYAKISCLRGE